MYSYLAKTWKNSDTKELKEVNRQRLISWRKEYAITRVEGPLRLDRAHTLGYRAKQGFIMIRVRVRRGGLRKARPTSARRQAHSGAKRYTPAKSIRLIAEERAGKKYPNLQVLNSFWVGEDGQHKWYEVILVDPSEPSIQNDPVINWICDGKQRGRASRGLTSAGKKVRGLQS
ncbi:50S ribosomal protein L15e [Candidatus Bathyarchaeota archaeon]|nr:50S ribosomal protein L15e [Candidatus Bathyarchaeota archaeon]